MEYSLDTLEGPTAYMHLPLESCSIHPLTIVKSETPPPYLQNRRGSPEAFRGTGRMASLNLTPHKTVNLLFTMSAISNSKQYVDEFAGEMTLEKPLSNTLNGEGFQGSPWSGDVWNNPPVASACRR
jgi:hypothetical protein